MHRTALALAQAALLSEDFQHHALDIATLRDRMAMAAVRAGDVIDIFLELLAHPDRARLLAGVEMHKSGNLPIAELHMQPFLEFTDRFHPPVRLQQFIAAEL
jgi:hypothetical protein